MKSNKKQDILFDGKGRQIPIISWIPSRSFCQLCIIHGFSEHKGYYQPMAKWLSENGVSVHMMDLPGHGMAGGVRGHIANFQEYLDNVKLLIHSNPFFQKTKPVFLLGHSLGGLISIHYCLKEKPLFKGLILSSPLTGFSPIGSFLTERLARHLAKKSPNDPFPKPVGVKSLSRNPDNWLVYNSDPCRGRIISPNLYLTMVQKVRELKLTASALDLPLLVFTSTKDSVISPDSVQRFFKSVGSVDKSLVVFTKAMHELFQEEESKQVIQKSLSWMKLRS